MAGRGEAGDAAGTLMTVLAQAPQHQAALREIGRRSDGGAGGAVCHRGRLPLPSAAASSSLLQQMQAAHDPRYAPLR